MNVRVLMACLCTIAVALVLAAVPGFGQIRSFDAGSASVPPAETTTPTDPRLVCDPDEDEDEDGDSPQCFGGVTSMKLMYTGDGCGATSNDQNGTALCAGDSNGYDPVDIVVRDGWSTTSVYAHDSGVFVGDVIEIRAQAAGDSQLPSVVEILVAGGQEQIQFDASCAEPLNVGDDFGSMRIVELTSGYAGTVTLADDQSHDCTLAKATVDPSAATLLLEGSFCDEPEVFGGQAGGDFAKLPVLDAGPNFIIVGIGPVSGLETCVIEVECLCQDCKMEVALGGDGTTGPAGPTGPTGQPGLPGQPGAAGPAGSTGAQGAQGATGPVGPAGATGTQGAQGATGPAGPAGATGTQGAQGATGPAGPAGATGTQGAQGATGPAGATGTQGAQGATGPAGPAGATGTQGAQGATGPAGPAGATGTQGAQGATGPAGSAGAQGPQGATGPMGLMGLQGATGPQGPTGQIPTGTCPEDQCVVAIGQNGALVCGPCTAGGGCDVATTTRVGQWCIENLLRLPSKNFVNASADCHAVGRSICPVEALMLCDVLDSSLGSQASCINTTDSNTLRMWTSTYGTSFGESVFQAIVVYGEDNKAFKGNIMELYPFYCCDEVD